MSSSLNALYLDSAASMPILEDVWHDLDRYRATWPLSWGVNLSSDHSPAQYIEKDYQDMLHRLLSQIKCAPAEWFWTSSATESNQWALEIALESFKHLKKILIHPLSHSSLRLAAERLAQKYHIPCLLAPLIIENNDYQIDWRSLESDHPISEMMLCLPWGDHELGSVEKGMDGLSRIIQNGGWVHLDAAQHFAKTPLDLSQLPCTSLTCSGHKFGSLPGVAALFVRLRPRKKISPLFVGGGQQNGYRSGTLPYLLLRSFCVAHQAWIDHDYIQKIRSMKKVLRDYIIQEFEVFMCSPEDGLPHIITFQLPLGSQDRIMEMKKNIAFSQGSACQKGAGSDALLAAGFSLNQQRMMIRLGLSPYNLKEIEKIQLTLKKYF